MTASITINTETEKRKEVKEEGTLKTEGEGSMKYHSPGERILVEAGLVPGVLFACAGGM